MRRILHISDLHFGRTSELLIEALIAQTLDLKPDLVVVSGDLTQRAQPEQFIEARKFLESLRGPKLVVPGNHDVPLRNLFHRVFRPLADYKKYIAEDLSPIYKDDEIAAIGINTARWFTRAGGSITKNQIEDARQFFCSVDPDAIKMVVTHHPFDFPEELGTGYLLKRAEQAIAALATCQADLYLAGHSHVPFTGLSERRYTVEHHTALIVHAGTSISTRTRSDPNSFNLVHVHRPAISVERFFWNEAAGQFLSTTVSHFKHMSDGWRTTPDNNSHFFLAG